MYQSNTTKLYYYYYYYYYVLLCLTDTSLYIYICVKHLGMANIKYTHTYIHT